MSIPYQIQPSLLIPPAPIQGNPDVLDGFARGMIAVAQNLESAGADIKGSHQVVTQYWDSTAARASSDALNIVSSQSGVYRQRLVTAATVVQNFSTMLREQQAAQKTAISEINALIQQATAFPNPSIETQLKAVHNASNQASMTVNQRAQAVSAELANITPPPLTVHPHRGFDAVDALIANQTKASALPGKPSNARKAKGAFAPPPAPPVVPGLHTPTELEPAASALAAVLVEVPGSLFGASGPNPSDVQQGQLGDCYLLASAAALAMTEPGILEQDIVDNGNGTYNVSLYGPNGNRVTVVVDDWFSFYSQGGAVDASPAPSDGGGKWAAILEKAYAEVYGQNAYAGIGQGGWPSNALFALTGQTYPETYSGSPNFPALLTTAFQNHTPATGITPIFSDPASAALAQQFNLVGDHVYYIKSFDPTTGLIQMGNPWGPSAAYTPAPMTVQQFQQLGMWVCA